MSDHASIGKLTRSQRDARRGLLAAAGFLLLWVGIAGCRDDAAGSDDALVVLLPRDAQEIDPRFVSDPYGLKISRLVFASLVTIDPFTLETIPDLAERVEVVSPVDYRVILRPHLKFSDGSSLDASDVVATFASVVDPKLATRYAPTYRRIARTVAVDARTIDIRLDGPHATFLTDLELPIMRAEDAHRHLVLGESRAPIGAGPYRVAARSEGRTELVANPHWHSGAPRFPRVRMLVVQDDNIRALRLLAGAGDVAQNAIPPQLIALFTPAAGFQVSSSPGIGTTYVGINTRAGSLRDVRVRQAIAHAIDRKSLVAAKLGGRARLARSFVPIAHWAFDPDTPEYTFDPGRARALLDAAGYPAASDGTRLRLTLRCGNDRFRHSIARAIAAMLHDVGIEADLRVTESATLIADLDRGLFDLTMLQIPEVIEPHVLSWFFASERIPGPGREGANRWRISNRALDAAFERGRVNIERSARIDAYREVQRILAEQLPVIPLWHEDVIAVRSERADAFRVPRDGRFATLAR